MSYCHVCKEHYSEMLPECPECFDFKRSPTPPCSAIRHLTQPTSGSCVPTCLAMIMGLPDPQPVIDRYGESFSMEETIRIMSECRIFFTLQAMPTLVLDGWYKLGVPSLNIPAANHSILARVEELRIVEVLDPCRGREGKLFYAEPGGEPGARVLRSWHEPIAFVPSGQLPNDQEQEAANE